MAQGHLRVTIIEAAQLDDKDKTDFNDPYVEVYIDEKHKQKTRALQDVERPVWNETFDFDVWPSNEYIHITVYDEDAGKKPDLIGSTKISLDKVIGQGQYDDWVTLSGRFGFGRHGDIRVRMAYEKLSTN